MNRRNHHNSASGKPSSRPKKGGGGRNRHHNRRRRGRHNQKRKDKRDDLLAGRIIDKLEPKRFGVVFYDNFAQAHADTENLAQKSQQFDQLNIVIKAEGDMKDERLLKYGMVYAGEAWHLIHTRRMEEGWYQNKESDQSDSEPSSQLPDNPDPDSVSPSPQ